MSAISQFASFQENKSLKKTDGAKKKRLVGLTKLDDANKAGSRDSEVSNSALLEMTLGFFSNFVLLGFSVFTFLLFFDTYDT